MRWPDHADWRTTRGSSWSDEQDSSFARSHTRAAREAAWFGHVNEPTGEWNGGLARINTRSADEDPRPDDVRARTDRANYRTDHRPEEIAEMA